MTNCESTMPRERPSTLALIWPRAGVPPPPPSVDLQFDVDREAFEAVQAEAGWHMPAGQWSALKEEWLPGALVICRQAGRAVGAACALRRSNGWIELAWVAVVPAARGQGLGHAICAALTRKVIDLGHTQLFGSTQDHRLAALHIYLSLGFRPVYRVDKVQRWQAVCAQLKQPFVPLEWGWPPLKSPESS